MALAFFEPKSFLFLSAYAHTLFDATGTALWMALVGGLFALLLGSVLVRGTGMLASSMLAIIIAGGIAQTHHHSFTLFVGGALVPALLLGWFVPRLALALWNGAIAAVAIRTLGIELGGGEFAFELFWGGFFFFCFLSLLAYRFFAATFSAASGAFVLTFVLTGLFRGTLGWEVGKLYEQRMLFAGTWATCMVLGVGFQLWLGPIDKDRVVAKWLKLRKPKKKAKSKAKVGAKPPASTAASAAGTAPPGNAKAAAAKPAGAPVAATAPAAVTKK